MKAKALHFGKAMSAALFVLLLSVAGTKNALAQTQLATLQHGDTLTAYYGGNAFVSAYTAAEEGDIITLSSGTFTGCTIDKSITVRGAGAVPDTLAGTACTILSGNFTMGNTDYIDHTLHLEGIYFNGTVAFWQMADPTFTRCNFMRIFVNEYGRQILNPEFVNCVIKNLDSRAPLNCPVFVNCVVWAASNICGNNTTVYNCHWGGISNGYINVTAYNSIIYKVSGQALPNNTCQFYNCIGIMANETGNPFGTAYTEDCVYYNTEGGVDPYASVYTTYRFDTPFDFEETYDLLPEIAGGFPTSDGTEVGIHGGQMPYTARPSYQMLRTINAAQQSDTQGKLNVEIEVINQ